MGDRCYMEVTVRKSDAAKFEEHLDAEGCGTPSDVVPGAMHYELEECNYAQHMDRQKAAEDGCVFSGWHGPGGEYSAMQFAAADGMMEEVDATDGCMLCPVTVDDDGKARLMDGALETVQRYLDLDKRALALMKEEADGAVEQDHPVE